ncbi:MAG: DUF177 domain-containing protein [Candidatus Sumerlaeota bacterium]|nr:DUF177 domain-containing protein [Candidatus Sumerlaeota bacterium]
MKPSSPLIVSINELIQAPKDVTLNEPPASLDLDVDDVRFTAPVRGHLSWRWVDNKVVATGRVSTQAQTVCSRCLNDVQINLETSVRLVYSDRPEPETDVIEIGMDEDGLNHFTGDVVDAREEIREAILLELPEFPVCAQNCKGLCPGCGADLNKESCACVKKEPPSAVAGSSRGWQDQIERIRKAIT